MKNTNEIKLQLASLVSVKMDATRARRLYRRSTSTSVERGIALRTLWDACRSAKQDLRYAQLAYALSRGRAYWTQERRCDRAPSAYLLGLAADCTTDEAKAWLSAPVDSAARAAFEAHEAAARARWLAARAERPRRVA